MARTSALSHPRIRCDFRGSCRLSPLASQSVTTSQKTDVVRLAAGATLRAVCAGANRVYGAGAPTNLPTTKDSRHLTTAPGVLLVSTPSHVGPRHVISIFHRLESFTRGCGAGECSDCREVT